VDSTVDLELTAERAPSPQFGAKPAVGVFDFDKTLTDRHSFWRFLRYVVGAVRFWSALGPLAPSLARFAARRMPLLELRERVILHFLAGFPADRIRDLGYRFALEAVPKWIRPEALARLRWHQRQGHRTLVVSNAPEDYLRPWARMVGCDDALGSVFEVRDGRLTGALRGTHCYGAEKVHRLRALLGHDLTRYRIFAYGDNVGDRELLQAADHAFYRTFE
jgi:phosphatidylglycerophosphatase C